MENRRMSETDAIGVKRAYRFLTLAVITKFAAMLMGLERFKGSLALTGEKASPQAVVEGGLLQFLAMADGLVSLLALVFFCLWLARATADGAVSLEKGGLPRRMGAFCALGVVASLLANLVSMGMMFVETGILSRSLLSLAETSEMTFQIPTEVPVLFLKVQSLTLAVVSALQVVAFLFFRALIRRTAEGAGERQTPEAAVPVSSAEVPPPKPEPLASEPEDGFGWPAQPER